MRPAMRRGAVPGGVDLCCFRTLPGPCTGGGGHPRRPRAGLLRTRNHAAAQCPPPEAARCSPNSDKC